MFGSSRSYNNSTAQNVTNLSGLLDMDQKNQVLQTSMSWTHKVYLQKNLSTKFTMSQIMIAEQIYHLI